MAPGKPENKVLRKDHNAFLRMGRSAVGPRSSKESRWGL
jgi:hypothetical protein